MKRIFSISILILALVCVFSQNADARKKSTHSKARTTKITAGKVKQINANQYKKLVANYTNSPYNFKGRRPAVIDFNATWCGPCRKLSPILDKLAQHYKGIVDFYSVDIDKSPSVAEAYGIEGIPTVIMFSTSGEYRTIVGLNTEDFYAEVIECIISTSYD